MKLSELFDAVRKIADGVRIRARIHGISIPSSTIVFNFDNEEAYMIGEKDDKFVLIRIYPNGDIEACEFEYERSDRGSEEDEMG